MKPFPREFDLLARVPASGRIAIAPTRAEDLRAIYPLADAALAHQLASLETCEAIRRRHPHNMWSVRDRAGRLLGVYAMAMLSAAGLRALESGTFDAHQPDVSQTAGPDDPVAAVYKWGVYTPGIAAEAIPLVARLLSEPRYRCVNLYGKGTTEAGRRIMIRVGFEAVADPRNLYLYRYVRLANRRACAAAPTNNTTTEIV